MAFDVSHQVFEPQFLKLFLYMPNARHVLSSRYQSLSVLSPKSMLKLAHAIQFSSNLFLCPVLENAELLGE